MHQEWITSQLGAIVAVYSTTSTPIRKDGSHHGIERDSHFPVHHLVDNSRAGDNVFHLPALLASLCHCITRRVSCGNQLLVAPGPLRPRPGWRRRKEGRKAEASRGATCADGRCRLQRQLGGGPLPQEASRLRAGWTISFCAVFGRLWESPHHQRKVGLQRRPGWPVFVRTQVRS